MGLWLKQGDDLVPVSGGGGGSFEGEHVLTGDPLDPPEELQVGQLLYDGDPSTGGGGDAGPHDHDEYLPLTGGTVTGDLTVDGNLRSSVPADFWSGAGSAYFADQGMIGGTQGAFATNMTVNGYRNKDGKWTSLNLDGSNGAVQIGLLPTGIFEVRVASNHPTGSAQSPPVQFQVTEAGPSFRAQPSKTRSTDEILERAETAEFPPEDDEGVATMDGHDEVPLFEVVTALLAKVKELSATVADQAEKIAALES